MKKQRTPARLLCEAIDSKLGHFCGNRPNAYIFIPTGFLQCDMGYFDYRSLNRAVKNGLKIYIELKFGESGAYLNKLYHRKIFFINIGNITDPTNIIRENYSPILNEIHNRHHVYSNIFVSPCQVQNFIKEFLSYLHFGDISLRTISWEDAWSMTTNSVLFPPAKSTVARWVSLVKI